MFWGGLVVGWGRLGLVLGVILGSLGLILELELGLGFLVVSNIASILLTELGFRFVPLQGVIPIPPGLVGGGGCLFI